MIAGFGIAIGVTLGARGDVDAGQERVKNGDARAKSGAAVQDLAGAPSSTAGRRGLRRHGIGIAPQASHRSEITSARACEFLLDYPAQRGQGKLNSIPDAERRNVLVIMAVDVSGSSHLLPRDPEMASLQLFRQASRGLREMTSRQRVTA